MTISKRGRYYYIWYVDENNKRQKISTRKTNQAEALEFFRSFQMKLSERKFRKDRKLLSQFVEDYYKYSASIHTIKSQKSVKSAFNEFIRIIGDIPISDLTVRDIEKFLAKKKIETSDWTAKKYYATLKSAFNTAVRWECLHTNPFNKVKKPKTPVVHPRYISKQEMQQLLEAIDDSEFKQLCIFAVSTGLRLGEITSLKWNQIDFIRKVVRVINTPEFSTKNRNDREVPMNEQTWRMMSMRKESAISEYVFHRGFNKLGDTYVSKLFKKHVRKAQIDDSVHFHCLRHTYASWLVQSGVNIYEVQKLLGVSSVAVAQVYAYLSPSGLHNLVERINLNI